MKSKSSKTIPKRTLADFPDRFAALPLREGFRRGCDVVLRNDVCGKALDNTGIVTMLSKGSHGEYLGETNIPLLGTRSVVRFSFGTAYLTLDEYFVY